MAARRRCPRARSGSSAAPAAPRSPRSSARSALCGRARRGAAEIRAHQSGGRPWGRGRTPMTPPRRPAAAGCLP
eukprot:5337799-Prymnesium_polylepis.1